MTTASDLRACCPSDRWVELVSEGLPYASAEALFVASEQAFAALDTDDWLQAFAGCSRIGALAPGDDHGVQEQAGVLNADSKLLRRLAAANEAYERRFGFIFMIRATGRSAEEILDALRARLGNTCELEFEAACAQQREIVRIRLEGTL